MKERLPDYLIQGEGARLFPVLSNTSKEGRTTSIVLACMAKVQEFGAALLGGLGERVGKRSKLATYTEVVFKGRIDENSLRPDGLIVLTSGSKQWRALVEAKVGSSNLEIDQIENYRRLAKENQIDAVITISNQFATAPNLHPLAELQKSRIRVPVFHWSWMHILTEADLLLSKNEVEDDDQKLLLNELRRFLTHESAGVRGFDRMPKEWAELNKLVSSGGVIPIKSPEAVTVLRAWHQETRDLSLILSRMTETNVTEKLSRKLSVDPTLRVKEEMSSLREQKQLRSIMDIPDAAAPLEIVADIMRRTIDIGMTLKAPMDKKSTKARLNWLLKQIKTEHSSDVFVRFLWPGKSEPTQFSIDELRNDSDICNSGKEHLVPHGFHVFLSKRLSGRFTQQVNFVSDLESFVPFFYDEVGSNLAAWKKSAPKIKSERASPDDVSTDALSEEAEEFEVETR